MHLHVDGGDGDELLGALVHDWYEPLGQVRREVEGRVGSLRQALFFWGVIHGFQAQGKEGKDYLQGSHPSPGDLLDLFLHCQCTDTS